MKWWDVSWNPLCGCTSVSESCLNCYARRLHNQRHKAFTEEKRVPIQYAVPFEKVQLIPDRLDDPLRWKKPRIVFVNSMGDLFHKDVPDEFILKVWNTMMLAPRHTFIVCTKRAQRMRDFLAPMPFLSNVWLGVTAENQERYEERYPLLGRTPAAQRFISFEPLLGPINWLVPHTVSRIAQNPLPWPDWCIVGGESGPGARIMLPEWAQGLRDDCIRNETPYWFKQWGNALLPPYGSAAPDFLDGRQWHERPSVER
jgi:protein gp37